MISLKPPYLNISGLNLFGDQDDPAQWYYYPNNARLATTPDGKPQFLLAKPEPDMIAGPPGVPAGTSLNFTVNLSVDAEVIADAEKAIQKLANIDRPPRLAPIQYAAGTTRLVFLEQAALPRGAMPTSAPPDASDFLEKFSDQVTPSLYGDQEAAFMLTLSSDAALLVESVVTGRGPALIGVVYDLGFQAAQTPLDVT